MTKRETENISYVISGFMSDELGLSGGELLVYAIIHSFTKGDVGLFYGTQDYLARASGLSLSTVKRALRALTRKNLIEIRKRHNFEGYATLYTEPKRDELMEEGPSNDAEFEIFPEGFDAIMMKASSPFDAISRIAGRPKYEYHPMGRFGRVCMTAEQCARLLKLVSADKLHALISRLDYLMENEFYHPKSCYKTLKKWIYKEAES